MNIAIPSALVLLSTLTMVLVIAMPELEKLKRAVDTLHARLLELRGEPARPDQ